MTPALQWYMDLLATLMQLFTRMFILEMNLQQLHQTCSAGIEICFLFILFRDNYFDWIKIELSSEAKRLSYRLKLQLLFRERTKLIVNLPKICNLILIYGWM